MTGGELLTGGQIVARTLRELGADTIFSVSGNQVLPIYDAVQDVGVRIIHVRHESAAAYAALGFAESTERPGVVLVSAGPGFLAAATGVAAVKSTELPLLFLSGATATTDAGAGGFQDLDQAAVARVTCKASLTAAAPADLCSVLTRAWELARAGVPGPVHVSLPIDVLRATGRVDSKEPTQPPPVPAISGAEPTLAAMADRLRHARRPLIIARPSANRGAAGRALWRLARNLGIEPVITECPRGQSDLKYRQVVGRYRESDCVLVIGPADFAVGFLHESAIAATGTLLQIDAPDDPPPRRVPALHLQLPPGPALECLAEATAGHRPQLGPWADLWSHRPIDEIEEHCSGELHPLEVAEQARRLLRADDVIVLDGGEYCQWIRLGLRDVPNRMLWNTKLGGIGGSIPTAVGLSAAGRGGRTIVFVGDGGFGYHASELETAVRYRLPIVVIVGNDARWGAEWHLQASRYGESRAYATTLLRAGYEQVARGLGAQGIQVSETASLRNALVTALSSSEPTCINVQIRSVKSPAVTH